MSQIAIIPKYEETKRESSGGYISKIYTIDGVELEGEISRYSVGPLRILTYVLNQKGIEFQASVNKDDPWDITKILLDDKYAEYVKVALQETMEYRCSYELENEFEEIIRQLPFEVAMRTSQNIMNFGKSLVEHDQDIRLSSMKWGEYNMMLGKLSYENPNETKDNIVIPHDNPILRKHLIYPSAHGGYNIKTKGYSDSSLDHYCFVDGRRWN